MSANILVSQTYEIVTPESAEDGEAADRGHEFEDQEFTFRELVELMREHPECSCGGRGHVTTENDWFSSYPDHGSREYFEDGEEKITSIHFSRENPPRMAKYWAKAARFAGLGK